MFSRATISIWIGIALLSGMFLMGQDAWDEPSPDPADQVVDEAIQELGQGNLPGAAEKLAEALAISPDNQRANFLQALIRIPVALYNRLEEILQLPVGQETVENCLRALGEGLLLAGNDVCQYAAFDFKGLLPETVPEACESSQSTQGVLEALAELILPEIEGALENLANLPSGFLYHIGPDHIPHCVSEYMDTVEIDYSDILAAKGLLLGVKGLINLALAYDADMDTVDITRFINERWTLEQVFDSVDPDYSNLGNVRDPSMLGDARTSLKASLNAGAQAIQSLLDEGDNQGDDLVFIGPDKVEEAEDLINALSLMSQGLDSEIEIRDADFPTVELGVGPLTVRLFNAFTGNGISIRGLLPTGFDEEGSWDWCSTYPDPTIGGMLPDLTEAELKDRIGCND